MSKELIERLRSTSGDGFNKYWELHLRAADLIEQLQAENERNQLDNASLAHRLDSAEKLIEQFREGLRKAAYMVRENTITPGGNPFALQEIEALAAAKQWKEQ